MRPSTTRHAPLRSQSNFRQYNNTPTVYMCVMGETLQVKLVTKDDKCQSYSIKIHQSLARAEAEAIKTALSFGYSDIIVVDSQGLAALKNPNLVSDHIIKEILKNDRISYVKRSQSQ